MYDTLGNSTGSKIGWRNNDGLYFITLNDYVLKIPSTMIGNFLGL